MRHTRPFTFGVSLPVTAIFITPGTGRARVFTATVAGRFLFLCIITRDFKCLAIVSTTVGTSRKRAHGGMVNEAIENGADWVCLRVEAPSGSEEIISAHSFPTSYISRGRRDGLHGHELPMTILPLRQAAPFVTWQVQQSTLEDGWNVAIQHLRSPLS
jgi:hypothetical protein